jgi:mannose-6-phosphate isomerase-like protein (cupin superfamily)
MRQRSFYNASAPHPVNKPRGVRDHASYKDSHMVTQAPLHITTTHLRLKPDGMADKLPVTPAFWPDLIAGKYGDFHNEYLVTTNSFTEAWPTWEKHPNGDEIVILLSGSVDFIIETPEGERLVEVRQPGEYAFVPKGHWHTANPHAPTTMLFITAGEGTQIRLRNEGKK